MKKRLTLCLSLFLMLTIYLPVSAAHNTTGVCTWELDGTHLTISGNGRMADYEYSCGPWGENITSVTIEDGITAIGDYAFFGCGDLTSIIIPDSVTAIGNNAFEGCTKLKSVALPKEVKQLELRTFAECNELETIVFPDGLTIIGVAAFDNCDSLTEVTIPEGVTTIGTGAFVNCSNLRHISLPDSVTIIAEDAFKEIPALMDKSNRYQGVVYFGNHAICHIDPDYEDVEIRKGTISIADFAFEHSNRLRSIIIPDSVVSIGSYAFSGCNGLTAIRYTGSQAQYAAITIEDGNEPLTKIAWLCEAEATTSAATTIPTEATTVPTFPTEEEMKANDVGKTDHGNHGIVSGFVISIVIGIVIAAIAVAAVVTTILMICKKKK